MTSQASPRRQYRFGLCTDQNMPWPKTLDRWRMFERLGFDSAWDCDHFVQPSRPDGPYFEAWTLLAALAAGTERIRLGVLVSCNTFRHPALLAKEAVTVDHVSNGRLELGLGAGWYKPEHELFGLDFPEPKELVGRFGEAVQIVDGMLRSELTSFDGRYYQLLGAPSRPLPVQRPRPPLTLAAHGPRMLRIVARYADAWNSFGTLDELRSRNQLLDEACAEVGRDPLEISRGVYHWIARSTDDPWAGVGAFEEIVGRYVEAGFDQFILDHPPDTQLDVMERVASEALPRFRSD